jgi:hypothetical protein
LLRAKRTGGHAVDHAKSHERTTRPRRCGRVRPSLHP